MKSLYLINHNLVKLYLIIFTLLLLFTLLAFFVFLKNLCFFEKSVKKKKKKIRSEKIYVKKLSKNKVLFKKKQ